MNDKLSDAFKSVIPEPPQLANASLMPVQVMGYGAPQVLPCEAA